MGQFTTPPLSICIGPDHKALPLILQRRVPLVPGTRRETITYSCCDKWKNNKASIKFLFIKLKPKYSFSTFLPHAAPKWRATVAVYFINGLPLAQYTNLTVAQEINRSNGFLDNSPFCSISTPVHIQTSVLIFACMSSNQVFPLNKASFPEAIH